MTKMTLAVLALALAIAMPAFAQSTTTQPSTQANPSMPQPPDQNSQQAAPDASNAQAGQTLAGTISADGKTLTSNNTTYNISNPNSVKAYANQPISVEYEMDTNNSIRITKVFLTKPQQ